MEPYRFEKETSPLRWIHYLRWFVEIERMRRQPPDYSYMVCLKLFCSFYAIARCQPFFCFFARHFEENPPARVCIETPLPRGGGFAVSLGLANLFRQEKIYLQCIVQAEDVIPHKCFAVFVQIVDRFTMVYI